MKYKILFYSVPTTTLFLSLQVCPKESTAWETPETDAPVVITTQIPGKPNIFRPFTTPTPRTVTNQGTATGTANADSIWDFIDWAMGCWENTSNNFPSAIDQCCVFDTSMGEITVQCDSSGSVYINDPDTGELVNICDVLYDFDDWHDAPVEIRNRCEQGDY